MPQIQTFDPSPVQGQAGSLGRSLGLGLARRAQDQQIQQQQSQLSNALFGEEGNQYSGLPLNAQLEVAKLKTDQFKQYQKQMEEQKKMQEMQKESDILSRIEQGQEVTPEERSSLSPTSIRTLIGQQKPTFEPTEEKLEAERVSKFADSIVKDYEVYQMEDMRLGRMEALSDKGDLSTPGMVKLLNTMGLPLGILGNPDTEEYDKVQADYVRDVSSVFPGQIRVYEIQAYMKTIPGLMNSKEGRARVIENRRTLNEGRKIKYDAYKEILKENGGRKPRNLDLLVQEKVGPQLLAIADKYKKGTEEAVEKFESKIPMLDNQGRSVLIPASKIELAVENGANFR